MRLFYIQIIYILLLGMCISCVQPSPTVAEGVFEKKDAVNAFDLDDIQQGGELIALTLYGPASYFEWRGEDFGPQYRLADAFGQSVGVSVRVEVCRSEGELMQRLQNGDGDVVAYHVPTVCVDSTDLLFCGEREITHLLDTLSVVERDRSLRPAAPVAWLVRSSSPQLAAALNHWLAKNDTRLLAMALPKPPSSSPRMRVTKRTRKSVHPSLGEMEGAAHYQSLFNRYAREVNWDWRLLAAQAYQESGFDPQAVSWMGAQGLMQLMPSTARSFGVHNVFDPEQNLRGATAFIKTLQQRYSSIPADERINFILAAYNAGPGHIDDARSLAKKKGLNADVWQGNVADIVLRMSDASYYNDPVCRHGYFRGSETYNYVNDIQARWAVYRSKVR